MNKTATRFGLAAIIGLLTAACASEPPPAASAPAGGVEAGVAAFRAGDETRALSILKPLAEQGEARAMRYLAQLYQSGVGCARPACDKEAIALLTAAARAGDNHALLTLETMRREGRPGAPDAAAMAAIERARASAGDALAAWRLAERYRNGDGVAVSMVQSVRWLKVAASGAGETNPRLGEAAYLLCQAYSRGEGVRRDQRLARDWCGRAAQAGHVGAALALSQLQDLN